jgi:two-component system cell cycle sensor histidine kinase/response regulator CckA
MMIARAAELLQKSPDGVVVHDGERIVSVNAAVLRLAGATRQEEVIGKPVSELFEHPYLKGVQQQLVTGTASREARGFTRERLYGLDGAIHHVDVHAQLHLEDERPVVLLILHDVQEQVAAERRSLEQLITERLLHTRVDARQVAGGVAHVLNNQLQIILGFANLIDEDPLTRDQRNDLDRIVRAAMDGAEVTRQLLQLAGGATCNPDIVVLDGLVRRLVAQLEAEGAGGARPMHLFVDPAPRVRLDPSHLRYMLAYLVSNARRAIQVRGRITITVGTTVIRHPQLASQGQRIASGRYGAIAVHDTGCGISDEARAHMFEPFFTTTMVGEGNGLGLPAVQGLLRQNGGFLTFSSDPEHGTTFTMLFPEVEAGASVRTIATADAPGGETTVLVIDACPSVRTLMARGLERVGYRVVQAQTAVEAMEVIAHLGCPALVVMTDEVERRAVRSLAPMRAHCADVPVVVVSTSTAISGGPDASAPSALTGAVVRLAGPIDEYVLVSQVQELLPDAE